MNESSTPVSISINVNEKKINTYTLNSLVYVETVDGCEVVIRLT